MENKIPWIAETARDSTCAHTVDGKPCGKPAVCVIEWKRGRLAITDGEQTGDLGRGIASLWIPICELHKEAYPDHDGFELDGPAKLS